MVSVSLVARETSEGSTSEAKFMLRQTIKIVKWFYSVYENDELDFDFVEPLPQVDDSEKLKEVELQLAQAHEEVKNFKEKVAAMAALSLEKKEERKQKASVKLSKL